jgi:hypothetical protein
MNDSDIPLPRLRFLTLDEFWQDVGSEAQFVIETRE